MLMYLYNTPIYQRNLFYNPFYLRCYYNISDKMFYAVSVHPENCNMYRFLKFDITENIFIPENDLSKMKDLYIPYKYKPKTHNVCDEMYKYMNLSVNNICSELLNELK